MNSHIKKAKNRIKSSLLPYYYKYYKGVSKHTYPDFLIIGALKSGTTSLYQYLNNHSGLVSSSIKETNFFSWEFYKGIKYYLDFFPLKKDTKNQLVFEACPHYLADPKSPDRIKMILPNVKIIAILRDPIERAISNYNYFANPTSFFGIQNPKKLDKRTVDEAFLDDLQGKEIRIFRQYCRLSLYAKQLEPYYKHFGKKNVLVLDFDELKLDPRATLKKVSDFLNIDNIEFDSFEDSNENVPSEISFERKNRKAFSAYNVQNYSLAIDKKVEQELIAFYTKDIEKLQRLTSTSFKWSNKYLA